MTRLACLGGHSGDVYSWKGPPKGELPHFGAAAPG